MGLEGRGIGHLFQGETPDVVRDTWELVAEGACEKYGEQCLEALGDGVWTKNYSMGNGSKRHVIV